MPQSDPATSAHGGAESDRWRGRRTWRPETDTSVQREEHPFLETLSLEQGRLCFQVEPRCVCRVGREGCGEGGGETD